MITAFKKYLLTLKLGPISRKLYTSDILRFLSFLGGTPSLELLSEPKSYSNYLKSLESRATAPSMIKRTIVSLRWFSAYLSLTYSLKNPMTVVSTTPKPMSNSAQEVFSNYIKHFIKYLNVVHLSPLTIKSYKSDIVRYLDWSSASNLSSKLSVLLNEKNIEKYLNYLTQSSNSLPSTIERKSKSIARFKDWYVKEYSTDSTTDNIKTASSTQNSPQLESELESPAPSTEFSPTPDSPSPEVLVNSVKKINYRIALSFGILSLFIVALAVFSYRQFSQNVKLTAAYPSTPTTPNRQLSFQGRLEDSSGTPITTATNLTFKLWDDPTTGSQLYTTGVCSLTPDGDGVFSTQIGGTCGSAIASSVFTENANVYLEVTVAAETLSPRQHIASVAYALNSETIQGFPISATVSAIRNTVVPMNQWGEIIVGEQSPRLTGVSGTFQISAPALSFITTAGSNGNITLAPDGTGQVNLNGNTTSTNFFNVSNAQLTTGSLITGTAGNDNTGFKLLELFSGSTPTSKFSVTDAGNVTLAGDLTITGDDLFMNTNTAGMILVADGTNFNPTAVSGDITINGSGATTIGADKITEGMLKSVNGPTDELCLSYESTVGDFEWQTCGSGGGGGSNWRITNGAISPNNDTLDLLVGNTATSSAKAGFINIDSGTPTATVSAGAAGGAFLTAAGNLSTTAMQSLTLGNSSTGNIVLAPGGTTALTAIGANLTAAGNLNLSSATNLIFGGTTSLGETTSAVDSGAYLVGSFDEFDNSASTNVQGVLNDLDATLTTALSGSSLWTDAGTYLYPTGSEVLGNSISGGSNKLAGIYLGDSAPLVFGTDNDINFSFSGSTLGSTLTSGSMIGIGTTTGLATLDVRSSLGTIPVASISGNTSMSALIVDQSGSGDIFTASSAGQTRFVVKNNGNVGIDVSNPTNKFEIGGSTSTISNDAGDITFDSASNNISFAGDSLINILDTYVSGELGIGVADAIGRFHVHGATDGKALAIFNELGDQDILVASSSGNTRARITNAGSLSLDGDYFNFGLTDSSSGYGFRDNGGTLQFKHNSGSWADVGSGGASWWDQTLGTLQPYNTTVDLLIGGTATSSAKFGLINVNSGTPTATISAGTSGGIYIDASGKIATTAKQTLALGDATTTGNIILQGGNVGIGVASPTQKLEVNGYIVGQRFEDSSSSTYYVDPAASGTSISIDGSIVGNGAFYLSTGNDAIAVSIGTTGAGKLDAGTIDPPYTINGEKFATYMTSMTGVKEETTGVVTASEYVPGIGYRATLDFATALTGSDLWLFSKVSSLSDNLDKLVVLLSGNGQTWYDLDALSGKLYLYAKTPSSISYRLTAPRFDSPSWLNTRDSDSIGFVIDEDNTWSVTESIANLFPGSSAVISPLSQDSISTISGNIVIRANQDQNLPSETPLLVVEGEISASTISARLAELENIQAENITAKNIVADTITANTIIGLDAKIASLSGITDQEFDSITDRIKARLSDLIDPVTAEDLPIPEEASASADLVPTQWNSDTASASATLSSADIDFVTINNYLAVIGQATITTLDVTSTLYTSSINSKTGSLALADNTLIIDPLGSVAINGDLTVSGKILAESASVNQLEIGAPKEASSSALGNLLAIYNEAGDAVATIDASGSANLASLTTNMITIASSGTATDSSALSSLIGTTSSNATAGVATLASPNTELTIDSPYVTPNSLIYLTPTTNTDNKVLFVKAKGEKSFTVAIDAPASTDISFNWWIIELAPNSAQNQLDQQI